MAVRGLLSAVSAAPACTPRHSFSISAATDTSALLPKAQKAQASKWRCYRAAGMGLLECALLLG